MSSTIYDLKLHETVATDNGLLAITRVPGGWIYESWRHKSDGDYEPFATVFVPFVREGIGT